MRDEFMTVPELADYLKLELDALWRYLRLHPLAGKDAQLPGLRMDGRWRFRKDDIDRWLRQSVQVRDDGRCQPSMLVVDDDQHSRSMLLDWVHAWGYVAHGAESGEAALVLLKEMSFELLLVDLQMPGMGGVELIRHARRLHPDARIVVVTAYGREEAAVATLGLGVSGCLEKPLPDLRVVHSLLELALGHDGRAARPATDVLMASPALPHHRDAPLNGASMNAGGSNGCASSARRVPLIGRRDRRETAGDAEGAVPDRADDDDLSGARMEPGQRGDIDLVSH